MSILKVRKSLFSKYRTIKAAIAAAQHGDQILIAPGIYKEYLDINKNVQLIGEGILGDVIITNDEECVIWCNTSHVQLQNLKIDLNVKRKKKKENYGAVVCTTGQHEITKCFIKSDKSRSILTSNKGTLLTIKDSLMLGDEFDNVIVKEGSHLIILDSVLEGGEINLGVDKTSIAEIISTDIQHAKKMNIFTKESSQNKISLLNTYVYSAGEKNVLLKGSRVFLTNSIFSNEKDNVSIYYSQHARVTHCTFNSQSGNIYTHKAQNVHIKKSKFENNYLCGVFADVRSDIYIDDCTFKKGRVGIYSAENSDVIAENCLISDTSYALQVMKNANLQLNKSVVQNSLHLYAFEDDERGTIQVQQTNVDGTMTNQVFQ